MKICVYCSSSDQINDKYFEIAKKTGELIGQKGHDFVFGGGCVGLMGEVAKNAYQNGSKVYGVIPEKLHQFKICFDDCEELIITKNMRDRKQTMDELSDAIITLPGGFGTLEEISEMITGKQLSFHQKPLVILDVDGFYKPLFDFFENMFSEKFANESCRDLYYLTSSPEDALKYIEEYVPHDAPNKWVTLK
jgi:uncharacterized protein (TIGR00730 family)